MYMDIVVIVIIILNQFLETVNITILYDYSHS